MRESPTIRTLLVVLGLVTFLPGILLCGALVAYQYQQGRAQVQQSALTTARLYTGSLDLRFQELRASLQALAATPELARGDVADFQLQARQLVSNLDLASRIVLVDDSGRVIADTLQARGSALPSKPPSPQVMQAMQWREPVVTNLDTGASAGNGRDIYLAVPSTGPRPYVVAATIGLEQLQKTLLAAQFAPSWTAAVLDRNGRFVARVPHQEMVGERAGDSLVAAAARAPEGILLGGRTREGLPVVGVWSRAPMSGYTVAIGIAEDELLAPLRRTLAWAGAAAALMLALVLGTAIRFARRIGDSIRTLSNAARQIGRDYVPGARRLAFREANQLQLALNMTAAELQAHEHDFDRMTRTLHERDTAEFEAVLRATQSPMVLVDEQLQVVGMNALACELFGIAMADAPGRALRELLLFRDEALGARARTAVPALAVQPDGSTQPVALQLSPFERGGTLHWIATLALLKRRAGPDAAPSTDTVS